MTDRPAEQTSDQPKEKRVRVRLIVHTITQIFRLDLGEQPESFLEELRGRVIGAHVVGPSKSMYIQEANGLEHCFNSDHVVCTQIEV